MAIPDSELEKVIKAAGLGERSARKLRESNKAQAAEEAAAAAKQADKERAKKPRGHGSAAPTIAKLGDDF